MIFTYEFEQKYFYYMDNFFDIFQLAYQTLFREPNPKIISGYFGLNIPVGTGWKCNNVHKLSFEVFVVMQDLYFTLDNISTRLSVSVLILTLDLK